MLYMLSLILNVCRLVHALLLYYDLAKLRKGSVAYIFILLDGNDATETILFSKTDRQ